MRKKLLIINLVDGRIIERDITTEKGFPLGAPANDMSYLQLCQTIAGTGYLDPDATTEKEAVFIGPSQIKTVHVKFT